MLKAFSIVLPILLIIIYLLDNTPYFKKTEAKLLKLYKALEKREFVEYIEIYYLAIIISLFVLVNIYIYFN